MEERAKFAERRLNMRGGVILRGLQISCTSRYLVKEYPFVSHGYFVRISKSSEDRVLRLRLMPVQLG